MLFKERTYSCLVVSKNDSFNSELVALLPGTDFYPVIFSDSLKAAKDELNERHFELVVINSPLPDGSGEELAVATVNSTDSVILFIVKEEDAEKSSDVLSPYGVFILRKPTTKKSLELSIRFMCAAYERMETLRRKNESVSQKVEEIKEINRAKWLLIYNLKMTEPEAHRYIEKQAMDRCVSRYEVAKSIVRTYK